MFVFRQDQVVHGERERQDTAAGQVYYRGTEGKEAR